MLQSIAVSRQLPRVEISPLFFVAMSVGFHSLVCAQSATKPDSFLGSWRVDRIEHSGVDMPYLASQLRLEFSETTAKLYQHSLPAITVTYTVDYQTGFMTWTEKKSYRQQMQEGIFEFRGDQVVLCVSAIFRALPERFETCYGDSNTLYVLSRIKPIVVSPAQPKPTWLPLGVLTLSREGETSPHSMIQLTLDTNGSVAGELFDLKTKKSQPVTGSIDKQSLEVKWFVGQDKAMEMRTELNSLTDTGGKVFVKVGEAAEEIWMITPALAPFKPDGQIVAPLPAPK